MKKKIENAFRLTLIDRIEPKKTMTNRLLPLSGRCAHTHTRTHFSNDRPNNVYFRVNL